MAHTVITIGRQFGSGGRIVAQGTPHDIAQCEASATGKFLHDMGL